MPLPSVPLATALFTLSLHAGTQATPISPADPNLQYIGRWDDSNDAMPWSHAQGSSVITSFTGTSVSVTWDLAANDYFRVIIDDDAAASKKIAFPSRRPLTLASGLAPGPHKLELVKETEAGRATFLGLELDAGESTVASPPRPTRRIAFYGDSNLAGYSLDSERNQGDSQLVGCYYGYAGITARMFDAEYHNISRSGATISSLNNAYDRIDWTSSTPRWDFSLYAVDVVVVNVGANDYWRPKSWTKNRYHGLLDDLRAAHPDAHIMLYNSFGWDFSEPANYIDEVIGERDDPEMSWAVFPWVFERYHGCQTDHAGMAEYLAAHLTSILGWTAAAPDVVSGYGQNGDVANGSFEHAAPFGGWGWRYFDNPGVRRVLDPVGAFHGDHYLQLTHGASSHQTNPAHNGDLMALSMWMRGASAESTVDVSISFRDQGGGGEINGPMEETTETLALSTRWQLYSMVVAAPSNPPNPVYSGRAAFVAGAADGVEIDRVAVGRPIADIQANGSTAPLRVPQGENLEIKVSLAPHQDARSAADWWLVVQAAGNWYHYDLTRARFVAGLEETRQAPLVTLDPITVFDDSSLPPGDYTFYFGVDLNVNGLPDRDQLYYDAIDVTVQ